MAASTAAHINLMVQNTHGLERIGDHCLVLVKIAQRTYEAGRKFSEDDLETMNLLSGLVDESLESLGSYLAGERDALRSEELEERIDRTRKKLRKRRIKALRKDEDHSTDIRVHLAFLDLITQMEEIGDRAVGIVRRAEAGPV
jgi:phosphate:Na+ symporter